MTLLDAHTIDEYTAAGFWRDEPLATTIAAHARDRPEAVAVISEHEQMTWREYDDRSSELAATLVDLLSDRGERVAIMLPDGPGVHVAYLATEKAGLVAVGIGPRAGDQEIAHLIRKTGANVLITAPEHRGRTLQALTDALASRGVVLAHVIAIGQPPDASDTPPLPHSAGPERFATRSLGPNDLFLLNSTSGTTGLPKLVTQFQNRWFYFHQLAVAAGQLTPADRFMSVVPAPFGFGLWTAHFTPALLGSPVVVMDRFEVDTMMELIDRHAVTVLACVSTQFIMMLNSPRFDDFDLTSLRVMFTGGEAVPELRAAEFEVRVNTTVLQFYGSNETGALSYTTLQDSRHHRFTTAGRIIPEMHVRLLNEHGATITTSSDAGQPACRGPATCAGYFADDEANTKLYTSDGWMLMGDICTIDPLGYLSVVGRTSDIIIRGGKNISAVDVEQQVATHPGVLLAAAVAMSDPVFGERVCVYVELSEDAQLALDDINAHLRARGVSPELWPERLEIRSPLPRSSGEKVAKGALRTDIEQIIALERQSLP